MLCTTITSCYIHIALYYDVLYYSYIIVTAVYLCIPLYIIILRYTRICCSAAVAPYSLIKYPNMVIYYLTAAMVRLPGPLPTEAYIALKNTISREEIIGFPSLVSPLILFCNIPM